MFGFVILAVMVALVAVAWAVGVAYAEKGCRQTIKGDTVTLSDYPPALARGNWELTRERVGKRENKIMLFCEYELGQP